MEYALEARDLHVSYPGFELQNISFSIPYGTVVGLVGENGAGKSTTIRMLLGATGSEASGTILFHGLDLNEKGNVALKNEIGVVFDDCCFSNFLNARKLDKIFEGIYERWSSQTYHQWLERFSLPLEKLVKDYSRGMRMRLSLAVALSHGSTFLILDEPTAGLDPVARNAVLEILQEFMLDERHSILFSSHITTDLEKIADHIICIHEGKVLFSEDKDTLLERHAICKGTSEQFSKVASNGCLIGLQTGMFGCSALCSDVHSMKAMYPDLVYEPVSIEELMVRYSAQGGTI